MRWLSTSWLASVCTFAVILCASSLAFASETKPSPYVGFQQRDIKALSDEQIEGYVNGRGMGFALAAELNAYPGPKHVLELASELQLTPAQHEQTQALFEVMHEEAVRLGKTMIEKEKALDAMFAAAGADEKLVQEAVLEIGQIQGAIRFAHLRAHLQMRRVLTSEQIHAYSDLRGYHHSPRADCPHGLR